jgi:hypothetical protein
VQFAARKCNKIQQSALSIRSASGLAAERKAGMRKFIRDSAWPWRSSTPVLSCALPTLNGYGDQRLPSLLLHLSKMIIFYI